MGFDWKRYEAWRQHPMLTNNLRPSVSLPGLRWGAGAFVVYVAYDKLLAKKEEHH